MPAAASEVERTIKLLSPAQVAELKDEKPKGKPQEVEYSLFVQLNQDLDPATRQAAVSAVRRLTRRSRWKKDTAAAEVSSKHYEALHNVTGVAYLEPGQTLHPPEPLIGDGQPSAPQSSLRRVAAQATRHHDGLDVLVGIIDVGGFDFAHEDFLDAPGTGTRWEAIWDQGGTVRAAPAKARRRSRFEALDYGAEILKSHMDLALGAARGRGLAATSLEPQSVMVAGSHGTHVASIAAGNRGLARRARLAGVLVSLRPEDIDVSSSFYDSTRIADAVDYLLALAAELGGETPLPIAINISLGTNGHAHDTSSAMARWIDTALTTPGRCVTVAAGNAGQVETDAPERTLVMGRIHAGNSLAATGLRQELGWVVGHKDIADISENEMEIWYSSQDRIDVEVRPPGGDWIGPIEPTEKVRNETLPNGTVLSILNETYFPANGANRISIVLSPFFAPLEPGVRPIGPVAAGEWRVRLTGRVIRDGRYDAWIERDDPRRMPGTGRAWRFPSFFAPGSYTPDRMISSLACAERLISVANVDVAQNSAHPTSSRGPTRDDRRKPDIGAGGVDVVAAGAFDRERPWIAMTGTSMASPYVCGVAALMLAISPKLTAAQLLGIVRTTSTPLAGHDFAWRNDTGFGLINPTECVREVVRYEDAKKNEDARQNGAAR